MVENHKQPNKLKLFVVTIVIVLAGVGLGLLLKPQAPQPEPPAGEEVEQTFVSLTETGLDPQTIKIKVGAQVTWTNQDEAPHLVASDPHPTHEGLGGLEGTALANSDSYSYTFREAGTFTYHDHLNPLDTKYQGTVIVE